MSYDPKNTAILLFSRSALAESKAKSLVGSNLDQRTNYQLAQGLITHSLSTARKTGLPLFTCFSNQQEGYSFGERLANALESVWAQGFDKVLIMGNDCPSLDTQLLLDSAQSLENQPLVLGPAFDGGLYLIGLQRQIYQRELFLSLAWEEEKLQDDWRDYAQALGASILWFIPLGDIDDRQDLDYFLQQYTSTISRYLLAILDKVSTTKAFYREQVFQSVVFDQAQPFRGPPSLTHP